VHKIGVIASRIEVSPGAFASIVSCCLVRIIFHYSKRGDYIMTSTATTTAAGGWRTKGTPRSYHIEPRTELRGIYVRADQAGKAMPVSEGNGLLRGACGGVLEANGDANPCSACIESFLEDSNLVIRACWWAEGKETYHYPFDVLGRECEVILKLPILSASGMA
jgi:hypothetical protein